MHGPGGLDVAAEDGVRRRGTGRLGRLLLACVAGDAWQAPAGSLPLPGGSDPPPGLAKAAHFHGVAGYAYRVLKRAGAARGGELPALEVMRAGGLRTHLQAVGDLPWLEQALAPAGVGWLVVKGPVLAALHGAPDLRAYSDLDVVVPAAGFGDALEALERAGARVLAANWWHRLDVLAGEVPLALPSGTVVDLHWHLLNDPAQRRVFGLAMPELVTRATTAEVHGRTVRTLGPVDTLLHLALHTALSGGNRLVWLKDVERLVRSDTLDRDGVVDAARACGLELVLATVLDKTAAVLDVPAAAEMAARLDASRLWRGLARVARHLPAPQRARGGRSADRLVSRSTRADLAGSLRELTRRAVSLRVSGRDEGGHLAPGDMAGPSTAGRRAFLAAVAGQ